MSVNSFIAFSTNRPLSKPIDAVRNSGNKVEPKCEPLPAVAVNAGKNSEYLHLPESVFVLCPQHSNHPVVIFVLLGERTFLGLLQRHKRVVVQLVYADEPLVRNAHIISRKAGFRGFEQAEVVRLAFGERSANYLLVTHYHQTFYRVHFVLSGVV